MSNYHSELTYYIDNNDNANANRLIMNELAKALVKDRDNFIEVLKQAGINVPNEATDTELIDLFSLNAPNSDDLLLNSSLLINHNNQISGFDGEEELSDAGVKATYKELKTYFSGEDEDKSNWVGAALGVASAGAGLANTLAQGKQQKRGAVTQAVERQTEARKQLIQQAMAQKQVEADLKAKKEKQKNTLLIVGVGVVGLVIVVGLIVYLKKKNN
jgi:hypothetical protein